MSAAVQAVVNPLQRTLLESRQRWRDLAAMAADIAFETDAEGRFTFVAPDEALGYAAAALHGTRAADLLVGAEALGTDPFRPAHALRRTRAWVRRAGGDEACLLVTSAPLLDDMGRLAGGRGIALDITDQERRADAVAARLRRSAMMDHIFTAMRAEVLAPRMMQAALAAARDALGATGAVVLDLMQPDAALAALHETGSDSAAIRGPARALLDDADGPQRAAFPNNGPALLACPALTRFGDRAGVVFWREAGSRPWDEEDAQLAASVTTVVRLVLEHDGIQREMARQARTDPLTGLLNRRAFLDEMARRVDRLDREGLPGTLMFVDVDNFKPLNDQFGHDAGDGALVGVAAILRNLVRPADLIARLGGDEFALWLDGADELTAAERAEALRLDSDGTLAQLVAGAPVTLSIGIACRQAGSGEFMDETIRRADQAMYEVKRAGRGHWRVARAESVP
jgi:diguanylate cyclase (GGDEF)-like protein/PAS domain S-box-containing protein